MAKRHVLVVATFLLSLLLYVDRVCISTAKQPIIDDLGLTDTQFGWVLSAFAFGYALVQTPAGAMADKMGPRLILTAVVTAWSVFTGLTAIAWNFASMLGVRFLFGLGEAGAFPGMARAVYSWIPVQERGLVKGINFSASRLGAAITMPLLPAMIEALGWRQSFLTLMLVGFVWAAVWWFWFRDEPSEHPTISAQELDYILANRQAASADPGTAAATLSTAKILSSGNMWLMMAQYFASNFTFFFCLSWLFPYIQSTYNLAFTEAGFYAMVPLLGGAVGNVFSGWLVDKLYASGHKTWSRRLPAIVGFGLASFGLLMSVGQANITGAVTWLTIAIFGADMILAPAWSFCIDIGGAHAGKVSGTMNMAGNLGSAIVAIAFPYLLEWTGGVETFFYVGAALNAVGMLCWFAAKPGRVIGAAA
jgi:ACS family glucarate transporter-like MFS transporter